MLANSVIDFIRSRYSGGYEFWLGGRAELFDEIPLQDHADIVYSLVLVGCHGMLNSEAAATFQRHIGNATLHGRPNGALIGNRPPNAHLTAYALGACRLLQHYGLANMSSNLLNGWDRKLLVDENYVPIWPRLWSHHVWRVSHWIGGVPSILLQLSGLGHREFNGAFVDRVLDAAEGCLNVQSGLLRPYRSDLLQSLFQRAYSFRHDPDLGKIGGVVHLLWIFHAVGRPYVSPQALFDLTWQSLPSSGFAEDVPYCLDFDLIQLLRTTMNFNQNAYPLVERANLYFNDVHSFLVGDIPPSYNLHKLPGALATLHECALISGEGHEIGVCETSIDIIDMAYWI